MDIRKESFGKTKDGKEVFLFALVNQNGSAVRITNYGGIVTSLLVPDKSGRMDDIVLGFDTLDQYLARHPYFGALIGRYGNRIAGAKFSLSGKEYRLAANEGQNHLHGGITGFDKVLWNASEIQNGDGVGLRLTYLSKDGEEGYPGNLDCAVTYLFNDKDELSVEYSATTDRPTVVNLTQHSYFNLKGAGNGDILDHQIMIRSDKITVPDAASIPTGELKTVSGSALDFNQPRVIGARIQEVPGGYDHNYVLADGPRVLSPVASVTAPQNGRRMEVLTTEPGIQFYCGSHMDGTIRGKGGKIYPTYGGLCLEAQHFPDSPNQPSFPSTVLNPGEKYHQLTVYKFLP
jgi:aldose 1-epimerase